MSRGTRSSSWASRAAGAEAGTVVNGFRIERLLGSDPLGAVYEATQISLGRTVALRLLSPAAYPGPGDRARFLRLQRLSAAVHHPNIVPTYEAGDWEGGWFVATRFVRGRTVAELLAGGRLSPSRLRTLLEPMEEALDAAHSAGLVHGRITAQNVLVDSGGTAYLADFGLGYPGSTDSDRAALAALVEGAERGGGRTRLRSLLAAVIAAGAALALIAAALLVVGGDDAGGEPPPPIATGTAPLGSELGPGSARSIGCEPEPDPNTPACTLSQASLAGTPTTVHRAGVIRSWAVRGAAGDVALQVIGRRDGRSFLRGFSQVERVADPGPHAFAANLRVERGDRIGLLLTPGAAIGARAAPNQTRALRWQGTLDFTPQAQSFRRLDLELMLRADIEPGARVELPQSTGPDAADAAAGEVLATQAIDLPGGVVRIDLVRVRGRVAIDAFRGRRRAARLELPDAEPSGRPLEFDGHCGYARGFCLRWLNEGDLTPLVHAYRLAPGGSAFRPIG